MPEGRGFLVRQPLRRLRRIGVLHDFPKREFPCAPRYWFIPASAFNYLRKFGGRALYPQPWRDGVLRHILINTLDNADSTANVNAAFLFFFIELSFFSLIDIFASQANLKNQSG